MSVLQSLIRVEVSAEPLIPGKSGNKDGRAYTIPAKQVCYLWQGGDQYPTRFELSQPETGPRRPGLYLLAGKGFLPGEYGRLNFTGDRNLDLVSFDDAAAAFAADAPKLKAAG